VQKYYKNVTGHKHTKIHKAVKELRPEDLIFQKSFISLIQKKKTHSGKWKHFILKEEFMKCLNCLWACAGDEVLICLNLQPEFYTYNIGGIIP